LTVRPDFFVDPVDGEVAGHADGVLDRFRIRAAVADDAAALTPRSGAPPYSE